MDALEQFRADTRQWLEENCPPSMRTPAKSDDETVWGGRKAQYPNPEAKQWLDAMASRGWTARRALEGATVVRPLLVRSEGKELRSKSMLLPVRAGYPQTPVIDIVRTRRGVRKGTGPNR